MHGREAMRIQEKLQGMAYLYLSGQQSLVQPQLNNHRQGSKDGPAILRGGLSFMAG
jgi:hypothetical protein